MSRRRNVEGFVKSFLLLLAALLRPGLKHKVQGWEHALSTTSPLPTTLLTVKDFPVHPMFPAAQWRAPKRALVMESGENIFQIITKINDISLLDFSIIKRE